MNENKLSGKILDSGKGEIHYFFNKIFGNSIPVIFLHGLSSNHTTWIKIMQELEQENISALAPDMRGHGYSDKTRKRSWYKIDIFTEDLEKILEKENINSCILLGYSFSGAVVLEYAKKYPEKVRGIILISANHKNPGAYKHLGFLSPLFFHIMNTLGWLLIWQRRKKYYYFQQGKSKGYWDSTLKGFATMPLSINYWMLSEMFRIDYGDALENINCPTLIIRSSTDPFFTETEMKEMSEKLSNCQCHNLALSSHFLATAHQDKIKDLIINFIKSIR